MSRSWKEQATNIVVPVILLVLLDSCAARPRRRFCEFYPFAPRCLGVAAKRSLQIQNEQTPLEIYSKLIKKILEQDNRSQLSETRTPVDVADKSGPVFDDSSSLLANLVALVERVGPEHAQRKFKRASYMDGDDVWDEAYVDDRDDI